MEKYQSFHFSPLNNRSMLMPRIPKGTEYHVDSSRLVNPFEPIPEEVLTAFTKATEELTGCDYMPVALLATQLVAGTNYCLLCQTRLVTPEAPVGYALVYLYAALDGSTSLLKVQEIEFSAFDTLD